MHPEAGDFSVDPEGQTLGFWGNHHKSPKIIGKPWKKPLENGDVMGINPNWLVVWNIFSIIYGNNHPI